ncbi:hypothetical protein HBI12_213410 [Parastagonospora nodorum]|nr:hypothetical protein HBI12_213410 [Parastagonospora nodorum]
MCAKDDLIRRKGLLRLAGELATAESLQRIKCTLGDVDSNTDYPIRVYYELHSEDYTLLARFISTTKIRDPLLKTLENAAKSRILLACADGRTRQYYLTICAILADYEEQVLLTSIKKNRYYMRCTRCLNKGYDDFVYLVNCFRWKHYNFNIYVSLATDILHLLLKGLVMKMLDFMQDMLDDIYPGSRKTWDNSTTLVTQESGSTYTEQKAIIQQLIAVVSLLFVSKAPFALHFIRAVCDLVTLAQYKNIRMYRALDSICTRANSEAYYITIVKQFYSITNKKDKRHNDSEHCDKEIVRCAPNYRVVAQLYLILIIIDYTCYDKDRKHIAYIGAFSEILLFNNNRQINNTTRMLSMPFKFYDLSTIICLVHLVPRDLPDLTTRTTMSYYVNNYID